MHKPAKTDHEIHYLLAERWSPVSFDPRPIEREKILSLLEAARWAPSSYNEQPWSLMIATSDDAADHADILSCLVDANRAWAKRAPMLLIGMASKNFSKNGKPNAHSRHDLGMALMSMAIQATADGLSMHMMAGFDADKARKIFAIPETHEAVTAAGIGYCGDPEQMSDDLQKRDAGERIRKSLREFVFTGRFGDVATLL